MCKYIISRLTHFYSIDGEAEIISHDWVQNSFSGLRDMYEVCSKNNGNLKFKTSRGWG